VAFLQVRGSRNTQREASTAHRCRSEAPLNGHYPLISTSLARSGRDVKNEAPFINGEENIIWKAPSARDPSFEAANAATQLNGQKDLFISGVLRGIVGGAAVVWVDHLYEAYRESKGKPPIRHIGL
jgi:hypothetical protein